MQITNFNITTKKGKPIVRNLEFSVEKGELLAIMGPSGSGKTTVLDLLTRNVSTSLIYKGNMVANGFIKYVSQEDHLHGFYTVRQYLKHYISLSYGHIPKEERRKIVLRTAECTGLTSALDTKVGDLFFKGLSGGQKRRLSIALELVSKPDILVLDEPTSGLDSVSAFYIIEVLKKLTEEGICVVCTLHQPSSQIWSLIDKVLLLSNGYSCYFGDTQGAQFFFESLGKIMPKTNYNPSDFYLFQINSDFDKTIDPAKISESFNSWRVGNGSTKQDVSKKPEVKPEALAITELASDTTGLVARENKAHLDEVLAKIKSKANHLEKSIYLCQRNFFNTLKNPGIFGIRLVMYAMLSFMIGFLYFDLGSDFSHQDIISRTSLLFYVDAFLVFMSIAVLPFFMIERAIVLKEVKNKLYKPLHYQIARFIAALPGIALIAIVSSMLVNLIANLNGFGNFFVILFLSLVTAESLAMLVSLIVPHYIIGMALIAGLYGMFMLVEGFLIVKDDIPGYFIWVHYLAFHTYSFEAFMYNEFNSITSFSSPQFPSGQKLLEFYSMDDTKIWKDVVILIGYFLLLEILVALVMAFIFRRKTMHALRSVTHTRPNALSSQPENQIQIQIQPSRQDPLIVP